MRIIAVMSPKGGIGKTTSADSIAYILGEELKRRVLIVEGDQQGDTSETYGCYEPEGIGMSELIEKHVSVGGRFRTTDIIKATSFSHIDIIPANGYLMQTDANLLKKSEEDPIFRLRNALKEIENAYDYCICDCGRLFDMVVINILMAAGLVIVPVKVGGYEVRAVMNMVEQIEDLKQINQDLHIKALMTMKQKNKTSQEFEEWLKSSSDFEVFKAIVRRSVIAERAAIESRPLPEFSPKCNASRDYREVVAEILEEFETAAGKDVK